MDAHHPTIREALESAADRTDELLKALQWYEQFEPRDGEDSNCRFERVGEIFYRETGYLRPGKDCVIHSSEARHAEWVKWIHGGVNRARAAIAKATGGAA